ncbi:hypothetical protein [Pyxidicoccus xibeiensis]|uniref:hypothetical protein n=1 Tax=Pyxidicoccus xibeiensis TaxID=2906759 RepID=UPI0020A6FE13|nr:hypothetical protein [Pyxidicoccus xibeiensis]MCP3139682.1 hypothetical protein [Pyxidicoccus xibeiensis]
MGVPPSNPSVGNNTLAAQEAARRAAEEAARRAAEAAARRAAEEAAKKAAAEAAQRQAVENARGKSTFEPAPQRTGPALDGQAPPSSTLLTEDTRDGQANCLDLAADWVANTTPELRGRSELVFLQDTRAGQEGQSGHVVVRQGDRVLDPSTQKSYANTEEYLKENPQYQQVGTLSGAKAGKIFSTAPGSPERQKALEEANISPELQKMMVADPGGTADTKKSLNPESVAAANKDYEHLKDRLNPQAYGLELTKLLREHAGDKDYQAQLIGRMKEGDAESAALNKALKGQGGIFHKDPATGESNPYLGRQEVVDAMKAAIEAGTLTETDINILSRGDGTGVWAELAPQLDATLVNVNGTLNPVQHRTREANETLKEVEAKEKELQDQLASFGPALTEDQRKAYVKAFQNDEKNKKVYESHRKALDELAKTLGGDVKALHAAGQDRPEDAKTIANAMALLGASPDHAESTVKLAGELAKLDPKSKILSEKDAKKGVEDAINQTGTRLMMESEPPEAGLEKLGSLLEPLKILTEGTKGGWDFANGKTFVEAYKQAKEGKFDLIKELIEGAKDPVSRGLARTMIGFGALAAYNAGKSGEYEAMLKEAGGASKEALGLIAQSTATASETGKWLKLNVDPAKAEKFANFAGRLAPLLGVGVAALSGHMHLKSLMEDPNLGLGIAFVGDVISGAGAILELTPAAPLGILISAGGGLVTATGELVDWFLKRGEIKEDQRKYLEAAGVSKKLIDAMADADDDQVKALVEGMGIPPERLQGILSRCPELLDGQTPGVGQLEAMLKSRGVHGPAAADLLDKMTQAGGDKDTRQALYLLANSAQYTFSGRNPTELTREDWDLVLNNARRDASGDAKKALEALG